MIKPRTPGYWALLLLALLMLLVPTAGAALLSTARLQAQPYLREFTVADGLPSSNIRAIAEDRFGYLWLASADGLVRFDGRDFRTWRTENGLRDNELWAVHVDARNQLWVGTHSAGLVMLSADRRNFRYFDQQSYPQIGSNRIWAITSTADGAIWFGTENAGLYRLAPDNSIRVFLPEHGNPRSLPSRAVGQLLVTDDGQLWVGTQNGVARWTGGDFERLPLEQLPSPLINTLQGDQQGRVWVGTSRGTVVVQPDGQIQTPQLDSEPGKEALQLLVQDSRGEYWYDTRGGLGLSRDGHWVSDVPVFSAMARRAVRPSWMLGYEDREGGLWFGSMDNGLWYLPANWRQFTHLQGDRDNRQGLRNPLATALAASSRDGLWVVGSGGILDHIDPRSGRIQQHFTLPLGQTWLRSVAEDGQGRVWIGTHHQLIRYDPGTGQLRRWFNGDDDNPAPAGTISRLVRCNQGRMWVFSREGGLQLRDSDGRIAWSLAVDLAPAPLQDIHTLQCGPDDQLWLGTELGVQRFDPLQQQFIPVPGSPQLAVYVMRFSVDGVLWLGHQGALSLHLLRDDGLHKVDRIDQLSGFPHITPNGLVLDVQGVAWVSAARGLYRVDLANRSVRPFGVQDGLRSQEFIANTLGMSNRGQVYAATAFGVLLLDPAALVPSKLRQVLAIERVTARQGDELLDLTHQTPLLIEPDMRDLQVNARLLSFADGSSNLYRFKLEGFDPDWVEVGNSGERIFSTLRSGQYKLLVQARTADNVWSSVQVLPFRVLPPWWASTTGIVLYALLLLVLVWVGLRLYRRRLQRINELDLARRTRELAEQASLAKTRFLANLGHEVRTPLTGVLGMSELLLASDLAWRERGYAQAIQQAGEHLLRLVNDALDLARIEAGKLELQQTLVDLGGLTDQVVMLMAPLAQAKQLHFVTERGFAPTTHVLADAVRLRQIMLNLLGNAIKFTATGQVTLRVKVAVVSPGLSIEIVDTGPGIADAQKQRLFKRFEQAEGARTAERYGGSGLGLSISNELAMAMGGSISVDSQPGRGARFMVQLPLPWELKPVAVEPVVPSTPSLQGLSILLVEDDLTVAEVICGLLQVRQHRVRHVGHGLAALAELAAQSFDIALLDLDLPGLDGIKLAGQLRAMGYRLPLLAVTARADAEACEQAMAHGFNGFLRKPVTGQMLEEAIAAAIIAAGQAATAGSGNDQAGH
ncbi:MAG: two-component regulator propeller domain-containing protein [Stenotrophomonas koreensis]